jgi:hypothetical protein
MLLFLVLLVCRSYEKKPDLPDLPGIVVGRHPTVEVHGVIKAAY